jgi:hypothetical protein
VPRQLPLSPALIFAIGIEHANGVTAQRLHNTDAGEKYPSAFSLCRVSQHLSRRHDRRHIAFRFRDRFCEVYDGLA